MKTGSDIPITIQIKSQIEEWLCNLSDAVYSDIFSTMVSFNNLFKDNELISFVGSQIGMFSIIRPFKIKLLAQLVEFCMREKSFEQYITVFKENILSIIRFSGDTIEFERYIVFLWRLYSDKSVHIDDLVFCYNVLLQYPLPNVYIFLSYFIWDLFNRDSSILSSFCSQRALYESTNRINQSYIPEIRSIFSENIKPNPIFISDNPYLPHILNDDIVWAKSQPIDELIKISSKSTITNEVISVLNIAALASSENITNYLSSILEPDKNLFKDIITGGNASLFIKFRPPNMSHPQIIDTSVFYKHIDLISQTIESSLEKKSIVDYCLMAAYRSQYYTLVLYLITKNPVLRSG